MPARAFLLVSLIVLGATFPIIVLDTDASGATLRVPTDFSTIQSAIDAATPGDTILVSSGTYSERIIVNKILTILGQSSSTTTINGNNLGTVVNITSAGVSLGNFTIENSGSYLDGSGVYLFLVSECNIFGNNIVNNNVGISADNASGNIVFHNNFVGNAVHVATANSTNSWDDGYPSGGNYWSNFSGTDGKRGPMQDQPGSDGILDSSFGIDESNVDHYPFSSFWRPRTVKNLGSGFSYSAIQEAIDAAETANGDTIHVYGGVFYENVKITKSVHLIGDNTSASIIDGGGAGDVVEISSTGATIEGLTLRNSGAGPNNSALFVNNVSSITVEGSAMKNSSVGLFLNYSSDCVVRKSWITDDARGIHLSHSQGNVIQLNNITSQSDVGLLLQYSNTNVVDQNVLQSMRDGLRIEGSLGNKLIDNLVTNVASYAVHLSSSGRNLLSGSRVTRAYIGLWIENADENMIGGNEISYNTVGVYLASSSNNTIYFNNFVENSFQVEIDPYSGVSNWNMSYPVGGNYWKSSFSGGSYMGVDVKKGPYQNEAGSDGIGDTFFVPASTNLGNKDYYPQMQAINLTTSVDIHDVGLTSIVVPVQKVYRGDLANATVVVSNLGNYTETFEVTAYYNSSLIERKNVSKASPRSKLEFSFAFNTTSLTPGIYTISSNVSTVSGEENLANNRLVGGSIILLFYRDLAVNSASVSSNVAYKGGTINVTGSVCNWGEIPENLTASASFDGNVIGTRVINGLSPRTSAQVVFSWNVSGTSLYHPYNVTINVEFGTDDAVPVNNTLQAGIVNVRLMGDTNGDRIVNIVDVASVAYRYDSKIGDGRYDILFDLNSNGAINIVDVALAAVNFGQST